MSWIKYAKPGDKVVCVTDLSNAQIMREARREGVVLPVVGTVYTIREIEIVVENNPALRFEELRNPITDFSTYIPGLGKIELAFAYQLFQPLQSRPTDISVFTDMLKTAPAPKHSVSALLVDGSHWLHRGIDHHAEGLVDVLRREQAHAQPGLDLDAWRISEFGKGCAEVEVDHSVLLPAVADEIDEVDFGLVANDLECHAVDVHVPARLFDGFVHAESPPVGCGHLMFESMAKSIAAYR